MTFWTISKLFENLPRYSKRISVPYWCQRHRRSIFTCVWVIIIFRFWIDASGIAVDPQFSFWLIMLLLLSYRLVNVSLLPHRRQGYSRLWCFRVCDLASPVSPCIGEARWHRRDSNISPQIFEKLCFDKHSHQGQRWNGSMKKPYVKNRVAISLYYYIMHMLSH